VVHQNSANIKHKKIKKLSEASGFSFQVPTATEHSKTHKTTAAFCFVKSRQAFLFKTEKLCESRTVCFCLQHLWSRAA